MRIKTYVIPAAFLLCGAYLILLSYKYEAQLANFPLINRIVQQRQEARQEKKIHLLNIYIIKDYQSLFDSANDNKERSMDDYIKYFQLISDYMPADADSYALLGFCYAHQKNNELAFENYKKALILNPYFFWTYYNLGLLLWYNGDTSQALILFQKALSLDPKDTLTSLASSKVYMDILKINKSQYDIIQSLKNGYAQTILFVTMIKQRIPPQRNFPPLQFF